MLSFFNLNPFEVSIYSLLLVVGYIVIFIIRYLFFKIRKIEGMGLGDAKLFLMVGMAWYKINLFNLSKFGSCCALVGILIIYIYKKDRNFQIPYGCFIVIASALYPKLGSLFYNMI